MTGIRLEDGTAIEADRVVVAIEADKAAKLTGLDLPVEWRVSTDITFALPERLYRQKLLLLFTEPGALVNNAALVSNIAPSYAPEGQHLLSATVLGDPALSDEDLAARTRAEVAAAFPRSHPESWKLLRVYRIRWAQYAQPAGIWNRLPSGKTGVPGLILAGEITSSSSLHGALVSGQKAAGLAMSVAEDLDDCFPELGALAWVAKEERSGEGPSARSSGERALRSALAILFAGQAFPDAIAEGDLMLRRDALGKPFVRWRGRLADWARERGLSEGNLHVSNSHDGGAHLVLAAYGEELVGLGVDAVHLPRLRKIGKDIAYLHRFARHFMGPEELELFVEAARHDDLEGVQLRVAAHFSLMEAASKACGTGLKLGGGMGTPASLAKSELGVETLVPAVKLLFGDAGRARLAELGARDVEARWTVEGDFLVSAVAFRGVAAAPSTVVSRESFLI